MVSTMRSEFSEFSFGFAFTHNLLKRLRNITSAPEFPSLLEEGKENGGYDVKLDPGFLGVPLFIQYKLSDLLRRSTALQWNYYNRSFFRFQIRSLGTSKQHNMLKALAAQQPDVNYVAPIFWTTTEFNQAFLNQNIVDRSIQVPLSKLPRLDDYEPHYVTFIDSNGFIWHTTEGEVYHGDFSGEHLISDITERFSTGRLQNINREFVLELREFLINLLREHDEFRRLDLHLDYPGDAEAIREVRDLLTIYFDIQFLVLRTQTTG